MKLLRKKFNDLQTNFREKFINCCASSLKRGDYLHISFILKNQKRRKGLNLRLNNQIGILVRKLVKFSSMSIIFSILFKSEKVKFYLNFESPMIIKIKYINKKLKNRTILKELINKS